ncbi:DUF421 domain-containing protein [Bacillus massilinigeriensis]|uniref:DUF421 domain-containing protein n=1 Tax=Bacillus mediterraneensis TaxID=1805474 RepID=UPI0008F96DC5|nr:DUF421 domain-containing protein [Bacillus mediterraneensis]
MYLSIALKLVLGLVSLLFVIRLMGKKELAQVTPFDFVYAIILGGILEEAIFDHKVTIGHLLYTFALWAFLIFIVEYTVQRFDKTRPLIKGEPETLIADGEINLDVLKKEKMEMEQLRSMLRQNGVFSVQEVKYAFLEPSGHLSVMASPASSPVTPNQLGIDTPKISPSYMLVDEGKVLEKALKSMGKNVDWLEASLAEMGYENIHEIYYAEWSLQNGFYVKCYQ